MKKLNIQSMTRLTIGFFVLISALLGFFVSKYWLLFTIFVGLNLIQFAFTKWCFLVEILKKLGFKE